jgi:hypothetical protein
MVAMENQWLQYWLLFVVESYWFLWKVDICFKKLLIDI